LSRQAGSAAFGDIRGDLYLPDQRVHVGIESRLDKRRGVDFLIGRMGFGFLQYPGQVAKHLGQDGMEAWYIDMVMVAPVR